MSEQITLDEEYLDVPAVDEPAADIAISTFTASPIVLQSGIPRLSRRPAASRATWLPAAVEQLSAIATLQAGWDADGAREPNCEILLSAMKLLNAISFASTQKPHINPTRSGGVQLEWENGACYFEIELVEPAMAQFYFEDRSAGESAEGTLVDRSSLRDVISYITRVVGAG